MRRLASQWPQLMTALLLLVIVWGLYLQTLRFAYVWDDGIIFLNKNDLMVEPLTWKLLAQPVLSGTSYFRPLVFLTWFSEFHLFGQNPKISHLINVALFSINTLLVFRLALEIFTINRLKRPLARAALAAAFYAIHPALIEAAAWVSGRFDLMCTTFVLLNMWIFINRRLSEPVRVAGVALTMLLAVFSKELGMVIPALLVCIGMTVERPLEPGIRGVWALIRRHRYVFISTLFIAAIYLTARSISMENFYHIHQSSEFLRYSLLINQLPLEALRQYVLIAISPFSRISIAYPVASFAIGTPARIPFNVLTLIALCGVIYFAFWKVRIWAWLTTAGIVAIALVLHVIPMSVGDNLVQTRFITLPLAFGTMALASLSIPVNNSVYRRFSRLFRVAGVTFFAGWFILAGFVTATTIPVWKDPLTLWAWAYQQQPDVAMVRGNYMQAATVFGRPDLAEKEIDQLRKKNGGLDVGDQILYASLLARRDDPEALKYIEGVMFALPDFEKIKNGRQLINEMVLTPTQVAGALMEYAGAKLIYAGDLDAAAHYNRLAQWYLTDGERIPLLIQQATIEYASGNFENAKKTLDSHKNIYYFGKVSYLAGMRQSLRRYCTRWADKSTRAAQTCNRLKSEVMPEAFVASAVGR